MNKDEAKKLEANIRNVLPELKEPTLGCEIRLRDYDGKYGEEYPLTQHIIYCEDADYGECGTVYTTVGVLEYDFDIVGHPVLAQDVLKVLPYKWFMKPENGKFEFVNMADFGTRKFKNDYFIFGNGSLRFQKEHALKRVKELFEAYLEEDILIKTPTES